MTRSSATIRSIAVSNLKEFGLFHLPVDVDALADKLNIRIRHEEIEDDMSGFLAIKNDKATIVVNKSHHLNRQRFTIAHEIGHYLLHVDENAAETIFIDKKVFNRNKDSSAGTQTHEIEANRFSAELLMPKQLIIGALEEENGNIDLSDEFLIYRLANKFKVSEQALGYRLGDLRLAF